MIPVVRCKPGVLFTTIAPGGFRILAALDRVALLCGHDLTITSACDGEHSGPEDPHHKGQAYDVRSHDLPDPQLVLDKLIGELGSARFYAFLEDPNTDNTHFHVQVRHGIIYP